MNRIATKQIKRIQNICRWKSVFLVTIDRGRDISLVHQLHKEIISLPAHRQASILRKSILTTPIMKDRKFLRFTKNARLIFSGVCLMVLILNCMILITR